MKHNTASTKQAGFSLLQALICTVIVAIMATVGIVAYTSTDTATGVAKLESDVKTLNTALRVYVANGGEIGTVSHPMAVIDKLKSATAAEDRNRVVGYGGKMIDPRLGVVMMTAEEAASDQPRGVWDNSKKRFTVATSGSLGFKKVTMDAGSESGATQEQPGTRNHALLYADNSTWVWDYMDQTGLAPPIAPTDYSSSGASAPPPAGNNPTAIKLNKPTFSLPPGNYPLKNYDLTLSLFNNNASGVSEILYSTQPGTWKIYEGEAVNVTPPNSVTAYAISIDPDHWSDSDLDGATYEVIPVNLDLGFTVPKLAVNFWEAGGSMIPGSTALPGPLAPGSTLLNSADDIPPKYQDSSVFTINWTYDGSDPLTSPTRIAGASFANGFPGQDVDYVVTRWGTGSSLPIKLAAKSMNNALVRDSPVVETTLTADPIQLQAPIISNPTSDPQGNQLINLNLVTDQGTTPVGARIFYTLDGSAPTPQNGILYTGSINGLDPSTLPEQPDVVWVIDTDTDKLVAVADTADVAGSSTDYGTVKYVPAAGGAPTSFGGDIGGATIDQNNEVWFVVNKPIAGYGARPLFRLDLDYVDAGADNVAEFVRDLPIDNLSGLPTVSGDEITSLTFDRTTGKFAANWKTQFGENHLISFAAYGTALNHGGPIATTGAPEIEYDLNGDFFVKKAPTDIHRVEPSTATTAFSWNKLLDGGYYVTDAIGSVVLADSVTSLETAQLDFGLYSLAFYDAALDEPITGDVTASYVGWAAALDAQSSSWSSPAEILGTPDTGYAICQWNNLNNLYVQDIAVAGSGTIIKVEAIAQIQMFPLNPVVNDSLRFTIADGTSAPYFDVPVADIIATSGSTGLIAVDITSARTSWDWAFFDPATSSLDYLHLGTIKAGADDGGIVAGYGIGFRVTTSTPTTGTPSGTVALAEPTTTTWQAVTLDSGETVTQGITDTADPGLLFVSGIDTSSIGVGSAPKLKRGKKPKPDNLLTVRAAVYGPAGYEQWFIASEAVSAERNLKSNNGHGNNGDGVDVSNPGQGGGGPNGEIDPSGGFDDEIGNLAGIATNPSLASGALDVREGVVLSWTPGAGATSHRIYFGTTSPPPFLGEQAGSSFTPVGLTSNTKYFWRIDEMNSYGPRIGQVWSFTMEDMTPVSLFAGGFEGGSLASDGWAAQNGDASVASGAAFGGSFGATMKKTTWIEKAVSTAGMHSVRLKYARQTSNLDSGEALVAEWWNGSGWQIAESTQATNYSNVEWALGTGADNKAGFKIRFRLNASHNNESANIDDVQVLGVAD